MDRRCKKERAKMNAKKCVLSNENLNGDEFVKVKYAREYLIKLGYWVSPSPYNKPVLILFLIMMFPLVSAVNFGVDDPDLPHLNGLQLNVTYVNQTVINLSGNPFDQSLNTSDNVTFYNLLVNGDFNLSTNVHWVNSDREFWFRIMDLFLNNSAFTMFGTDRNFNSIFFDAGGGGANVVAEFDVENFRVGMNNYSDIIYIDAPDPNVALGYRDTTHRLNVNGSANITDDVYVSDDLIVNGYFGVGNSSGVTYDGLVSKMMLRSDAGAHGGLVFESDADRVSNIVFANDGDSKWHLSSRHEAQGNQLRFFQSNGSGLANPVIAFTQDHRIGFGTNAPDFKFEVKDTDSANTFGSTILINGSLGSPVSRASLIIFNSGGTVAGRGNGIFFGNNNETHGGTFFAGQPRSWSAPYSNIFSIGYNNATVGGINSGAASDLAFTITGNGRVGINTIARGINLLDLDPVDQHAGLHIQPSSASGPTYYIDVEDQFGTKIFTVEPDGTVAFNNFEVPNNNAAQSFLGGFVAFTDAQTTIQNNINVPGRIPLALLDLKNTTLPTIVFATHTDPFPNREWTGYIDSNWSNATQGAHRGDIIFGVSDFNGNREALRLSADGSNANAEFSTSLLSIDGNVNVTGNLTSNFYYGEIYVNDSNATVVDLVTQDAYVPLQNFTVGLSNGFIGTGSQNLTPVFSGIYKADYSISFSGQSGSTHGMSVGVNGFKIESCYSQRKLGSVDVGNSGGTCILDLDNGDNVTLVMDDEDVAINDVTVASANLNLVRVGN